MCNPRFSTAGAKTKMGILCIARFWFLAVSKNFRPTGYNLKCYFRPVGWLPGLSTSEAAFNEISLEAICAAASWNLPIPL